MKRSIINMKYIILVAGFLVVSVGAFAAGKKTESDEWSWRWMGSVESPGHMFPNTSVAKFIDTSNGVVCYVYASNNATSVQLMTNGVTKEGVNGSEIGTMSCVPGRR